MEGTDQGEARWAVETRREKPQEACAATELGIYQSPASLILSPSCNDPVGILTLKFTEGLG
jgi:hypothetical protein